VETHDVSPIFNDRRIDMAPEEVVTVEEVLEPPEVTLEMKDELIARLIEYCGKIDAPARFKTMEQAIDYFNIPFPEPVEEEPVVDEPVVNEGGDAVYDGGITPIP